MNAVVVESRPVTAATTKGWLHNYIWLVKRELWEHRSLYIALLVVSGVMLLGMVVGLIKLGQVQIGGMDITREGAQGDVPRALRFFVYLMFSIPFALVAAIVTVNYSLDALYAERRDRSVLFWKSLPLSDSETVVAKLGVAALVVPLITLAISVATQLVVFATMSIVLAMRGQPFMMLWTEVPIVENLLLMLYVVIVHALWYLPIWAWCLLVSAWARRAPFLWAIVPIGALRLLEYLMLGTNYIGELLRVRASGGLELATAISQDIMKSREAIATQAEVHFGDLLTPGVFLSSPQLWGGLVVTAGLVAATVWVRRYREAN